MCSVEKCGITFYYFWVVTVETVECSKVKSIVSCPLYSSSEVSVVSFCFASVDLYWLLGQDGHAATPALLVCDCGRPDSVISVGFGEHLAAAQFSFTVSMFLHEDYVCSLLHGPYESFS